MANRVWTYHDVSTTLAHTSSGTLIDFTSGLQTQVDYKPSDVTAQRIVGHMSLATPAGGTAYDSAKIFLGIVPVSGDARAAGAYPEPFSDNVPWMWTHGGTVWVPDSPSASLATPLFPDHVALPHIDIQTNRRIHGRDMDLVMIGYDDSGITGALSFQATLRVLWKINS